MCAYPDVLDVPDLPPRASNPDVRVRFCPSPTGNPHVGMVRTALFNWAFARHTGGTFVFRIEDTDSARDTEESYRQLVAALSWLGLDWDEGPGVGGAYGPYRQSQRLEVYRQVARDLLAAGRAYECFCTPEELEERRERARREGRTPGYDGHCRDLADQQVAQLRERGRTPALRFRMPGTPIGWDDLVRGPVSFGGEHVPDFVLVRANGEPLYTLVNPVDDARMRITHVLRGEDLLSSTPRQIALYDALAEIGVSDGTVPRFGHLPYVMGEGNKKLSKRDPQSSLNLYREEGYLPEGLLNYLALLGWSMGEDREFFSKEQMAAAFSLDRVSVNPARFDLKKCTAINADWVRALGVEDLAGRVQDVLVKHGVLTEPVSATDRQTLAAAIPLIQERMETLGQAVGMIGFLFVPENRFSVDPADAKMLGADSGKALAAARAKLAALSAWSAPDIESVLRQALVDGLGLKPKVAFGSLRVAVTGRRVSPPLFESIELLGRDRTLARIDAALGRRQDKAESARSQQGRPGPASAGMR
ncbi:MAG: glutamate--tRNA ligase [Candidatus Nanopelagicales bacterium]